MEDNISKIKERLDIVDVIGSYIQLKKAGINFKARCPFHNEKTGSFFVSPERQIWHCFGCGLGGDIFGFIKQVEGVEFVEALRILATRAGVELTYVRPELRDHKAKLFELNELAARFFEKQLVSSDAGAAACRYLQDRSITEESISAFRLGYAPNAWDTLYSFLRRSYGDKEIVDAGLAIKKDSRPGHFDRFRSRIMFPIKDVNGRVIGFTGRVFGELADKENVGKYVNTPQTALYDKSRVLYGLDVAKLDIRRVGACLLVEGNTDVIMSHQAGVKHAVATSGTALTQQQLTHLKRYTDTLHLAFDTDEAGDSAAQRGIALALSHGFTIGMVTFSGADTKDPADYIARHGESWGDVVGQVRPFMEVYVERAMQDADITSAQGKKELSMRLLPMIASLSNKVEQAHWVADLALTLKVKDDVVFADLAGTTSLISMVQPIPVNRAVATEAVAQPVAERMDIFEESLLGLLLKRPGLASSLPVDGTPFLSSHCTRIIDTLKKYNQADHDAIFNALTSIVGDEKKLSLEFAYLRSQELWNDYTDSTLVIERDKLLHNIKRRSILAQLEKLEYDIKSAERQHDSLRVTELMHEFSRLSKQISYTV